MNKALLEHLKLIIGDRPVTARFIATNQRRISRVLNGPYGEDQFSLSFGIEDIKLRIENMPKLLKIKEPELEDLLAIRKSIVLKASPETGINWDIIDDYIMLYYSDLMEKWNFANSRVVHIKFTNLDTVEDVASFRTSMPEDQINNICELYRSLYPKAYDAKGLEKYMKMNNPEDYFKLLDNDKDLYYI